MSVKPGPRPCPICERPAHERYRPFCSRRCADIDLGRWLKGGYRIPTAETPGNAEREDAEGEDRAVPDGGPRFRGH